MVEVRVIEEALRDLASKSANELTKALAAHFESLGGLAFEPEKVIARELVRRARLLEKVQAELAQLRQGGGHGPRAA
jgi:hypothetical protein